MAAETGRKLEGYMSVPYVAPAGSSASDEAPPAARRNHRLPATDKARLRDMLACLGIDDGELEGVDPHIPIAVWQIFQGGTLLLEGEAAATLYVVRSGTFKAAKVLEDGYEQVLSFALPGELLGSVALHGGRQASTVIALEDSTAYALLVCNLREVRRLCPVLDAALQRALSWQLVRAAETTAMSAAVSSDVRLARFLLWMSRRIGETGQSSSRLLLRMSRRDIASLLCVAHETVSRGFTNLTEAGYVLTRRKEVEIINVAGLRDFATFTRGSPTEPCRPFFDPQCSD
jgi:CRP/FNR family transcriptional regulator, anaerobic regulatory protein